MEPLSKDQLIERVRKMCEAEFETEEEQGSEWFHQVAMRALNS